MHRAGPRFVAAELQSPRLVLEPLRMEHAAAAAVAFNDPRLHTYQGGCPATEAQLRTRFARQMLGHSADGDEDWLNWMVRDRASDRIAATVQSTVYHSGEHHDGLHLAAEAAWVVAIPFQGRGVATEAAGLMTDWLRRSGVDVVIAHIHPDHQASNGVARRLGLHPTDHLLDGELRWTSRPG